MVARKSIRVRPERVRWLGAESLDHLSELLEASTPGEHRAYVIRLAGPEVALHYVFADRDFARRWEEAGESSFALEEIERLFLDREPTPAAEPATMPSSTAYELDTGAVWLMSTTRSSASSAAPREAVDEAPAMEIFTRTPHIDVDRERPAPGDSFALEVFCDRRASDPEEEASDVRVELPEGWDAAGLQVWLVPSPHFRVAAAEGEVRLERGKEESTRARFDLEVVATPPPGDGRVTAVFAYEGRPCGQVTRTVSIGAAAEKRPAAAVEPSPAEEPRPAVEVHPDARRADLTITIKAKDSSERKFSVRLGATYSEIECPEPFDWCLSARAPAIVEGLMEDFQEVATDAERITLLRGAGYSFWDAAPKELKDFFWELADAGAAPETIFIVTDDWAFPWELAAPRRPRDGGWETREPLGVEAAVGRWVSDDMRSPPQGVDVAESYILAPRYDEEEALPHAAAEADYVRDNLEGEPIDPGDFARLEECFGEHAVDLAHFACHGEIRENGSQRLRLAGHGRLRSEQIAAMPNLSAAIAAKRPFVFLNACELGRAVPTLVGAGGFATEFARVGASCVLAPLWSVEDEIAHDMALAFYGALGADPDVTPAAVLKDLRARAYATEGADSWAAYCFYGDPLTQVTLPGPAGRSG